MDDVFYKELFYLVDELNPFRSKDALKRLQANPKTAEYLKDPKFLEGIKEIGKNHQALQK